IQRKRKAQEAVQRARSDLESQVQLRTQELESSNRALRERTGLLERYQRVSQNRELQMIRIKLEVNELLRQAGKPPKYPNAEHPVALSAVRSASARSSV